MSFCYQAFGLTIESDLELVGLNPVQPSAAADVVIRAGRIGEGTGLRIEGVATFRVREGREIVVDARPGVPIRNVQLYLLGSALGLLLHQRGVLPLHAAAFGIDDAAVAIMGASGAGKSTLAALLGERGAALLSDDVAAIHFDPGGKPVVAPGLPRLRLWGEALDMLGRARDGARPAYAGPEPWDKWDVPVPQARLAAKPMPLAAVYLLADGPDIFFDALRGASAVEALAAHTYRGDYLEGVQVEAHWRSCVRLAAAVPVFRLSRPRDLTRLDALGSALLEQARGVAGARTAGAAR